MNSRIARINSLIMHIVSGELQCYSVDAELGMLTVVRVDTYCDLSISRVYVSSLDKTVPITDIQRLLRTWTFRIQRAVRNGMTTRRIPKIVFAIDDSADKYERIETLLNTTTAQ
jgi:ribosome-binding factor A